MSMTAYEVWMHMGARQSFCRWRRPLWFYWPNDFTPSQVDELQRESTP